MKIYKYRFCKVSEIDKLKDFIDKHWKKGHILSRSEELIKFQHHVEGKDTLTFVVAENQETGEFDGVFGYISNWKYAPSHQIPNVQWGAVWKVREDIHNEEIGKVGLGMLRFILKTDPSDVFSSLGISGAHKQLATSLNYNVGDMNRYYIPNISVKDYKVILNPNTQCIDISPTDSYVQEIAFPAKASFKVNMNPYKDIEYFDNRYHKHPFFKYYYMGLYKNEEMKGVFVYRKIDVNGSVILRIMDFVGDLSDVNNINASMQQKLKDEKAEYIDCLNHGISSKYFEKIGFIQAFKDSNTIIPEYFDPFEQKYVPMEYAYIKDDDTPLVIFKGDGDQDRPNSI